MIISVNSVFFRCDIKTFFKFAVIASERPEAAGICNFRYAFVCIFEQFEGVYNPVAVQKCREWNSDGLRKNMAQIHITAPDFRRCGLEIYVFAEILGNIIKSLSVYFRMNRRNFAFCNTFKKII